MENMFEEKYTNEDLGIELTSYIDKTAKCLVPRKRNC